MEKIYSSVIIMASLGLVFGVLLALVGRFLRGKGSELYNNVRGILPGANCGACGYTGCDGYAAALCEMGGVDISLCTPGGADVRSALATALNCESSPCDVTKMKAVVKCNGSCKNNKKKAVYKGALECRAARLFFGGERSCVYGCFGYGDCTEVCPTNAIEIKNALAHISREKCIGCTLCRGVCPNNIIEMEQDKSEVAVLCSNREKGTVAKRHCTVSCIACGKCKKICPTDAIVIEANLARIISEKCINCGECVRICPMGTIKKL